MKKWKSNDNTLKSTRIQQNGIHFTMENARIVQITKIIVS